MHNSDGVWLRLTGDSTRQYCNASSGSSNKLNHSEAWVLQYNKHLGKSLLVAQEEPKNILDQVRLFI